MSDFIGVSVEGLPELQRKFDKLPSLVCDEGVDEANKYIVNSMQLYPPPPPINKRTQRLRKGWHIIGSGMKSIVANEVPYAKYVQGDSQTEQARHIKKRGWKGIDVVVSERMSEIIRKFEAGAKKAIRILGL